MGKTQKGGMWPSLRDKFFFQFQDPMPRSPSDCVLTKFEDKIQSTVKKVLGENIPKHRGARMPSGLPMTETGGRHGWPMQTTSEQEEATPKREQGSGPKAGSCLTAPTGSVREPGATAVN